MTRSLIRGFFACCCLTLIAACATPPSETAGIYAAQTDGDITLPEVPASFLEAPNRRADVVYVGEEAPGTIVVDPFAKFLYLVEEGGKATRYPVAVGREGRGFRGNATIRRKEQWPGWTPTKNMLRSEPEVYGPFAGGIPGGVASPLGARALYLYRGGKDTRYRIHGTNDMESIGNANSAGCIRMFNQDVIHLADQIELGTNVVVRTYDESVAMEGEELANRGVEMPPKIVDPEAIYAAVEAEEKRKSESE
ncbi:Lipoprotein-anchoring transpeptidase ErfK/SrfK [Shimia gijangensis]|uniref:Lipoprotein-anchoring transpeptidase ErfK/SrfK n=1 Tax=Shimia gijangensis TaxID=1470563 RepID=A0A1M6CNT6_9RHOB|nr:L,D-transpeptidase [Shimia gijangensis]SHI62511.1 Lipoprotein-anchoring transpeptidase ErfK/SrfK [Shimia gijangensis]